MTPEKAEKVANILIGIAAAAAAYYVLRDRSARRQLWQIVKTTAAASGPWLIAEARRAWVESGASGSTVSSSDGRARAV